MPKLKLDHIQLAMPPGGEELARSFFAGVLEMVEEQKPYPLSERGGAWFRNSYSNPNFFIFGVMTTRQ